MIRILVLLSFLGVTLVRRTPVGLVQKQCGTRASGSTSHHASSSFSFYFDSFYEKWFIPSCSAVGYETPFITSGRVSWVVGGYWIWLSGSLWALMHEASTRTLPVAAALSGGPRIRPFEITNSSRLWSASELFQLLRALAACGCRVILFLSFLLHSRWSCSTTFLWMLILQIPLCLRIWERSITVLWRCCLLSATALASYSHHHARTSYSHQWVGHAKDSFIRVVQLRVLASSLPCTL